MRRALASLTLAALGLLASGLALATSSIYVAEFRASAPPGQTPQVGAQVVTISGTDAATTAFAGNLIRVYANVAACIAFNATAATSTAIPLSANTEYYFRVNPGDKLHAITCTP